MPVHVLLLRAIGPATHALMSMGALRERCVQAGFTDVATVGNTGNLLLRSPEGPARVRREVQAIVDGFGIRSEVFIRSAAALGALVAANPFPAAAAQYPAALGVCFFHAAPRWPAAYEGPEDVAILGDHLVVDYHGRVAGSRIEVEKRTGMIMTQRNWTTVTRLAERAAALG